VETNAEIIRKKKKKKKKRLSLECARKDIIYTCHFFYLLSKLSYLGMIVDNEGADKILGLNGAIQSGMLCYPIAYVMAFGISSFIWCDFCISS
jgi:hypothetical protein